ncbi:MAG: methyl-accepting chemotaxis protein [Burkholderiales bacterium]|nr:methyl-accepting chemotaxis protein [Burkholderiales bacterium]
MPPSHPTPTRSPEPAPQPAAAPQARPAAPRGTGTRSPHGPWAPGVRLFRKLSFAGKSLLISIAFCLPLLVLAGWTVTDQTARLEAAHAARAADTPAAARALDPAILGLERDRWLVGLLVMSALGVGGYLFRCYYLVMQGGMKVVADHMSAIAHGDLTRQPRAWGNDEAAHLLRGLAAMHAALREVVGQVRDGSDAILVASREISGGSNDLAQRTANTASMLEASVASIGQITGMVDSTADRSHDGAAMAADNVAVARRGGEAMGRVSERMERVEEAAGRIRMILGVIDDIAFQTNLLALNAAVEAARAGDSGRAFGVVATEVRRLSGRSATAAREIRTLIESTLDSVEQAGSAVGDARQTIDRIVERAEAMTARGSEIAADVLRQNSAVAQVRQTLENLDRGSQQDAAVVEQTASAVGALYDQAQALNRTVARFRLPAG